MPINSFLYPGAKVTTAYEVANSCRFNGASDDGLNRTLGTPTNNYKWTISFWLKRTELGVEDAIMTSFTNTQNRGMLLFRTDDQLEILDLQSDSYVMQKKTNRKFRDVSAWYHIVISSDATLSSPETKFYVNGVEETSFATTNEYTQNQANKWNSAIANYIGNDSSTRDFSGYLAEFVFVDGQALAADQFGEFDSDSPTIWKPIDVSGLTFGNNGFYLDFEDSSNLGNDANGGTDWTVSNLTAVDQSTDTCTNNFATLNPIQAALSSATFSEGNLKSVTAGTSGENFGGGSSIGVASGKWYFEAKATVGSGSSDRNVIGVTGELSTIAYNKSYYGSSSTVSYQSYNGKVIKNESDQYTGSLYATGDIIQIALDIDNLHVYFGKNGTWQNSGNPESGSTGTGAVDLVALTSTTDGFYFVYHGDNSGASGPVSTFEFNFGSPSYSESGGETDGNGYGNFNQSVPSGYYALNVKNLAEYG